MMICLCFLQLVLYSFVTKCTASETQHVFQAGAPSTSAGPLGPCDPQQYSAEFESAEHQLLGDSLLINIDGIKRTGANFAYPLGANGLSFGQIVAMADFFSNSDFPGTCYTQISDPGYTPQQRQALFDAVLQQLNQSTAIDCLTGVLGGQSIDTSAAADPAQCFADRNAGQGGWDFAFTRCAPKYLSTAVCNWDHFGQDAITAYVTGHTSALLAAHQAKDQLALFNAYLIEAFAQHYLSDLFSAGHIRAPRRALHSTDLVHVGDQCNKRMHDEDSANGLWVRNALGQAWPLYGDKQLFASKSNMNKDQAFNAMQASADEVLKVYKSKQLPDNTSYIALAMVPILPEFQESQNFDPMFAVSADGKSLLQRANLDDRSSSTVVSYALSDLQSNPGEWNSISSATSGSGAVTNMYPRTVQRLTPESNLTQIRQLNLTHLILNQYGPVWTRLYQYFPNQTKMRSWNMLSQSIGPTNLATGSVAWQFAQKFSADIFVLIGAAGADLVLLGMQSSTDGSLRSIWSKVYPGGAKCQTSEYTVGHFNSGSSGPAIVRTCQSGGTTNLEVYTVSELSNPPALVNSWSSPAASASFVVNPSDKPAFYVQASYNSNNDETTWSFTTFTSSYTSRNTTTFTEPTTFANQKYLPDKPSGFGTGQRIIRISAEPSKSQVKIDVLKVLLDGPSVQTFTEQPVIINNLNSCSALDWFLMDINGDSRNDLVAYCPSGPTLTVLTFFQQANGGFGPAATTTINNDFAQDFTGDDLKHIKSFPVDRFNWFNQLPQGKNNSILQLFDNYGILGARLLAPSANDAQIYEPVGQYPAIAGQISQALGPDGLGFILDEIVYSG